MRGLTGGKERQQRPTGRLRLPSNSVVGGQTRRHGDTEPRARPRTWSGAGMLDERPDVTTCCCWLSSNFRLQRTQTLGQMMTGFSSSAKVQCFSGVMRVLATLLTVSPFIRPGGFYHKVQICLDKSLSSRSCREPSIQEDEK